MLAITAGFFAPSVLAQNPLGEPETDSQAGEAPQRFWQATLQGGHYIVALDRISSVSRHQYLMDGGIVVDEVTVDTIGQVLARFYFISALSSSAPGTVAQLTERAQELADDAAQRAGVDAHQMVVKKYPETTHARTVEYRLQSEKQLADLYASVRKAWESGRGSSFKTK